MFLEMRGQSLTARPSSVYCWATLMSNLAIGYGFLLTRKIVRSRDVVFFEDETIEDIVKPKKPTTTPQVVDMDSIPSPVVHGNHRGDDCTEGASSSQGDDEPSDDDEADEDADVDDTLEEP